MALPNEREALLTAWRALAGRASEPGWRCISVATYAHCHLLAGRRFPGNEEALLAGFHLAIPPTELPLGHGFVVLTVDLGTTEPDRVWFGLVRQPAGNPEMFTLMAADIVSTLGAVSGLDEGSLFRLFLDRIRAWQNFMRRGHDGLLSPEAEIGLHGELILLGMLIDAGLEVLPAVDAWRGPLHGLHDFETAAGAIEVKTTASEQGFPVKILSLEQLDPSLAEPLYLAGIHLSADSEGLNLTGRVEGVRQRLRNDSATLLAFSTLLLHAGYADTMADRYPRRFVHDRSRLLRVDDRFPNLIRSRIPSAITTVRYEIDLDRFECEDQMLTDILLHNE
ncbi:MAG: PD-(D/E)XK motif protein [Candidatus Competibacter sp.]|nr:PD-(D/E)XK motif protein [Candidatus Competibacter sp.]MDG4584232.1 PD-(D/E)XK motif protein [Candidatus Competibacter sp.]